MFSLETNYTKLMLAIRTSPCYQVYLTDGYLEPGQFDHIN
jgi:hypothetical protein